MYIVTATDILSLSLSLFNLTHTHATHGRSVMQTHQQQDAVIEETPIIRETTLGGEERLTLSVAAGGSEEKRF